MIPKHEAKAQKTKQPKPFDPEEARYGPDAVAKNVTAEANDYRLNVRNSSCIEEALDGLASIISTYVTNERDGENGSGLYSTKHAYPVKVAIDNDTLKLTLADNDNDDTMDRLVTAFERIADSVAKLAGLTRPRLESWHEQDEYEPRYKDMAVDGGAPGPKG